VSVEAFAETIIRTAEQAATLTAADLGGAREWSRHLERDEQLLPRIRALRSLVDGSSS
jgi:hypothetical protein